MKSHPDFFGRLFLFKFVSVESAKRYGLAKTERLCRKFDFEQLLSRGDSFVSYPLRIVYRIVDRTEESPPAQIAISVSKRRFKRAVRRNRIKRLVREAYRINKHILFPSIPENRGIHILFIYLDETLVDYVKMEKAISGAFKKIHKRVETSAGLDTDSTH